MSQSLQSYTNLVAHRTLLSKGVINEPYSPLINYIRLYQEHGGVLVAIEVGKEQTPVLPELVKLINLR